MITDNCRGAFRKHHEVAKPKERVKLSKMTFTLRLYRFILSVTKN